MFEQGRFLRGCVSLVFLAICAICPAADFTLAVDDISGLDEPWPLVGGLPFPEGALQDASQVRIVNADGVEVPTQIDVAATWRDGSIRWALAGFTANPRQTYRVEYGPGIRRSDPATPLAIEDGENGQLQIDTGTAIYTFTEDGLMPESGRLGETSFLSRAGDGAYLVDKDGRIARVAGPQADVQSEIVKAGPTRAVIQRQGWYVNADGERVAQAKSWFYFAAGTAAVRVTHTLVLTQDTNEWWIRDYGIQFNTPQPAAEVAFALSNPVPAVGQSLAEDGQNFGQKRYEDQGLMFSGMRGREWRTFVTEPADDDVYMLQETYPHFFDREYNAVIARVAPSAGGIPVDPPGEENLWSHDWEQSMAVAGDWADGRYADHGLTVVMPWLAQRFPKEIAFGPQGARVAFWSGRSGRNLDFRPATLVREYWNQWGMTQSSRGRGPGYSMARAEDLAAMTANAEGAARTHDVWLLPRDGNEDAQTIAARATAATRPPLVLADPVWLTSTEAVGWPIHPKDTERFPRIEEVIGDYWNGLLAHSHVVRPTGFIEWGRNPYIRGHNQHFRIGKMEDYYLRRNSWGLYARSGERRYWEYASRFNRFSGDYAVAHTTGGDGKEKGAFVKYYADPPIHWGFETQLWARYIAGNSVKHWLLGYYLTGDEYDLHIAEMVGDAYKAHWDESIVDGQLKELSPYDTIERFVDLYTMAWDPEFLHMATVWTHRLIDLDNPTGRSEISQNGPLYKGHRKMYNLYTFYRWTGDEKTKASLIKGLDFRYRFGRIPGPFGKNWADLLYSEGYRWTGRPEWLSVVKHLADEVRKGPERRPTIHHSWHILGSVPSGLTLLAEVDESAISPYPVLKPEEPGPFVFTKDSDQAVTLRLTVRMSNAVAEDAPTVVQIATVRDGKAADLLTTAEVTVETMFATKYDNRRDLRRRYVELSLPAGEPAGRYIVTIPDISSLMVLDTNATEVTTWAP